ncbi:hypothetical protein VE03_07888 [Pseudogymnoascus sp. 23342-1-I1]|nr:hypothetical protein VE03_07888 [Pseudogymnoascus sp. 23342-1-I1]
MKVSHYAHDDPTGHGAQYNMSPPIPNPNYRSDAPQYTQAHQDQTHMQHAPHDQQQYGYASNQQVQPHRASQSSQGQGGQGDMLGRVPTRGPNPLMPLDSPSNPNGEGALILPAVQQQAGGHPPSFSMIELGRRYTLEVMQQPKRARMCGFGDKDRRPITPPPCIRVVITDVATGNEIDTNDIDHGSFVLTVDLWSDDGKREVNLVRHSTQSPAISSTIPTSYAQAQAGDQPVYSNQMPTPTGPPSIVREPQYPNHTNQPLMQGQYNPYSGQPPPNAYGQPLQQFQQGPPQGQYGQPQQQGQYGQGQERQNYHAGTAPEPPNHHIFYHTGEGVHPVASNAPRPADTLVYDPALAPRQPASNGPQGMYTRNLIGSLAASASKLADPHDKIGIWFVLQDMSIRSEGNFRLRFSFTNVGGPSKTPNGNPANQMSVLNTGKAPVLALCYSDVFTVYSAKKFPGVVESTPLSKCFATQGVKIPIRKDGGGKAGQGREDYDED